MTVISVSDMILQIFKMVVKGKFLWYEDFLHKLRSAKIERSDFLHRVGGCKKPLRCTPLYFCTPETIFDLLTIR